MQFSPIRTAIIAIVALLGILFTIPSFLPENVRNAWPGFLPRQTVVLGLDLQGGSHLLLQVNEDGIVSERLQTLRRDVRNTLANDNGIGNLIKCWTQPGFGADPDELSLLFVLWYVACSGNEENAGTYIRMGMQFILSGSDHGLLLPAMKSRTGFLRGLNKA